MDEAAFWKLIVKSGNQSKPSTPAQARILQKMLEQLPAEEILAFDRQFIHFRDEAYDWDLWAAAFIMHSGCSDDGFDYFRAGLIALGPEIYYGALRNPESLADLTGIVDHFEELFYVSGRAYKVKTGRDMPNMPGYKHPAEPKGNDWKMETVAEKYPRLAKKFDFSWP